MPLSLRFLAFSFSLLVALAACSDAKPIRNVRLVVTDEGHYFFEGKAVSDIELKEKLLAIKAEGVKIDLHILGSSNAKYEQVGRAVKIAQDTGVDLVGFVTEPPVGAVSTSGPISTASASSR